MPRKRKYRALGQTNHAEDQTSDDYEHHQEGVTRERLQRIQDLIYSVTEEKPKTRLNALKKLHKELSTLYIPVFLFKYWKTISISIKGCLDRRTADDQLWAARCFQLLLMHLGKSDTSAKLMCDFQKVLSDMAVDSAISVEVRRECINALVLGCYGSDQYEQTTLHVMRSLEKIYNQNELMEFQLDALRAWSVLLCICPQNDVVCLIWDQLPTISRFAYRDDLKIRTIAGETFALLYELAKKDDDTEKDGGRHMEGERNDDSEEEGKTKEGNGVEEEKHEIEEDKEDCQLQVEESIEKKADESRYDKNQYDVEEFNDDTDENDRHSENTNEADELEVEAEDDKDTEEAIRNIVLSSLAKMFLEENTLINSIGNKGRSPCNKSCREIFDAIRSVVFPKTEIKINKQEYLYITCQKEKVRYDFCRDILGPQDFKKHVSRNPFVRCMFLIKCLVYREHNFCKLPTNHCSRFLNQVRKQRAKARSKTLHKLR